tara:strand:- start:169 stop:342 length:174 start_codon:yes stop_codon:yes gene_type:complete
VVGAVFQFAVTAWIAWRELLGELTAIALVPDPTALSIAPDGVLKLMVFLLGYYLIQL